MPIAFIRELDFWTRLCPKYFYQAFFRRLCEEWRFVPRFGAARVFDFNDIFHRTGVFQLNDIFLSSRVFEINDIFLSSRVFQLTPSSSAPVYLNLTMCNFFV